MEYSNLPLRALRYQAPPDGARFPFTVPIIRTLDELTFDAPITFFVGENGSGKSTLLEALAVVVGLPTVGSDNVEHDRTLDPVRDLARCFKLVWNKRTRRGFFMRSEDFFGFVKRVAITRQDLLDEMREAESGVTSDYARGLARMPFARELHDLKNLYGDDLDANSHGESYFALFRSRFVPDGLYLLDEPEAPLSPMRQLALMSMLKEMIGRGAQFIIATHSPILLAYPGATIYSCDEGHITRADYESLEHVVVTRDFLLNREAYLRHLMG